MIELSFSRMIEYQMDQTIELNRQKFASDPMVQNYLQAWRALFPGTIEIDVYEDITEVPLAHIALPQILESRWQTGVLFVAFLTLKIME